MRKNAFACVFHQNRFWGLVSRRSATYTEMIRATKLVEASLGGASSQGPRSEAEPAWLLLRRPSLVTGAPVVLQLGGADPSLLCEAAAVGARLGFAGVNLNCGCPSARTAGPHVGTLKSRVSPLSLERAERERERARGS